VTTTPPFVWTALVPFRPGQGLAVEIRKFVFSIRGTARLTAVGDTDLGLGLHVPPQLGIDEVELDLALTWRGTPRGNALAITTTQKGKTSCLAHEDVRIIPAGNADKVRVEGSAADASEKDIAFTIARAGPAVLTIGDIAGFSRLDGATITIRPG
jgi:hypothetical protein